jgi:hypothetical protein
MIQSLPFHAQPPTQQVALGGGGGGPPSAPGPGMQRKVLRVMVRLCCCVAALLHASSSSAAAATTGLRCGAATGRLPMLLYREGSPKRLLGNHAAISHTHHTTVAHRGGGLPLRRLCLYMPRRRARSLAAARRRRRRRRRSCVLSAWSRVKERKRKKGTLKWKPIHMTESDTSICTLAGIVR